MIMVIQNVADSKGKGKSKSDTDCDDDENEMDRTMQEREVN
jgi:hypothetical protein